MSHSFSLDLSLPNPIPHKTGGDSANSRRENGDKVEYSAMFVLDKFGVVETCVAGGFGDGKEHAFHQFPEEPEDGAKDNGENSGEFAFGLAVESHEQGNKQADQNDG